MNIKAVLIDDEHLAIEELSFLLSKIPYVNIIGQADCGIDGLNLIKNLNPDLVFADIKMPDMTGLQLSKEINRLDLKCKIIFTTAYDQYAIEAFNVNATDYILKPYEYDRVLKAVLKVKNILENNNPVNETPSPPNITLDKLPALKDDKLILIDIKNILLIYTKDRNVYIQTSKEIYDSNQSLHELEEKLSKKGFFRTHRSYLINLNKIREISPWFNGAYIATIEGIDDEIPISRNNVKSFKQILGI